MASLLPLQLVLLVAAIGVAIFLRAGVPARAQGGDLEGPLLSRREGANWYAIRPVDSGILEVAFAVTAAAMALPAFLPGATPGPSRLMLAVQLVLMAASSLSGLASVWLYRIYVDQKALSGDDVAAGPGAASSAAPPTRSRWSWIVASGPYSLLGGAVLLLLVGTGLTGIALGGAWTSG